MSLDDLAREWLRMPPAHGMDPLAAKVLANEYERRKITPERLLKIKAGAVRRRQISWREKLRDRRAA